MGKNADAVIRPGSGGGISSGDQAGSSGRVDASFTRPSTGGNQVDAPSSGGTSSGGGSQSTPAQEVDADEEKRKAAGRKKSKKELMAERRGVSAAPEVDNRTPAAERNMILARREMDAERRVEPKPLSPAVEERQAEAASQVEEASGGGAEAKTVNQLVGDLATGNFAAMSEGSSYRQTPDGRTVFHYQSD